MTEALTFSMRIRHNISGEIVNTKSELQWHDHTEFFLTEGNYGCDCNRCLEFYRAKGVPEEEICDTECLCGGIEYSILDITLSDGTIIQIDDTGES